MSTIANTEQYDAWNGESAQRWVKDDHTRSGCAIAAQTEVHPDAGRVASCREVPEEGLGKDVVVDAVP